jgi:hypothetical protein
MSQTSDFQASSVPKASRPRVEVETSSALVVVIGKKKLVCDGAAQSVMVILLTSPYFCKEYYHTRLSRGMSHKLAGASTLSLLGCVALSSLVIWY